MDGSISTVGHRTVDCRAWYDGLNRLTSTCLPKAAFATKVKSALHSTCQAALVTRVDKGVDRPLLSNERSVTAASKAYDRFAVTAMCRDEMVD